jgi:Fe-S cluster assembly protein SufD
MPVVLDSFVAEAERLASSKPAAEPVWVARRRRDALVRFQDLGFPTIRDEEWRFTNVAPIAEGQFVLARNGAQSIVPADLAAFGLPGAVATVVFVNGRYVANLSRIDRLPAGVQVSNFVEASGLEAHLGQLASADGQAFSALNTAFLADGAYVHVPASTAIEGPIQVLFVTAGEGVPTMAHPRLLIVMEASSQASVVESHVGIRADRYFTNAVTEIVAAENATLNHYRVQRESAASFHVGGVLVRAARNSNVACHSIALGGAIVRNDVTVVLDGEGGFGTLNGLYLGDGTRLVDNHTTIDHAQAHCGSREVYKGILGGHSRAVFNGRIIVRQDAQKTDARQTNKALLLSGDAQINTKPQLEIFADDVKCTHGAAVGQMDEDAIFYLRARGMSAEEARLILVHAFAGDVLNQMPLETLRHQIEQELSRLLPGGRG